MCWGLGDGRAFGLRWQPMSGRLDRKAAHFGGGVGCGLRAQGESELPLKRRSADTSRTVEGALIISSSSLTPCHTSCTARESDAVACPGSQRTNRKLPTMLQ